tara:strand:- start:813 stop:926 length:114 start_codon:yes stop_codon:yes gene_type:complete
MDKNTTALLQIFGLIIAMHLIFFLLVMVPNKTFYFFG